MPKTVAEGFNAMIGWVKPTETETVAAASHRASVEVCLKNNLGMTSMFRAGSFGHGTSVSGYSDIDYFAIFPASKLQSDSSVTLRNMRAVLETRFPRTGVYVSSPAVVVPFGTTDAERHEITPAYLHDGTKTFNLYAIPDRATGWMTSCPTGHNAYTDVQNNRLAKQAKQVIRLVKLWNYLSGAGLRSIYLEMRVSKYLSNESSIIYSMDVNRALLRMLNEGLAAMQDPLGLTGLIHPCSAAVKPTALSKVHSAVTRSEKALAAEKAGDVRGAFDWWRMVFPGWFPTYG